MSESKAIRKTSNINSLMLIVWFLLVGGFSLISEKLTGIFVNSGSDVFDNVESLLIFLFQYVIAVPAVFLIFRRKGLKSRIKGIFCKPKKSVWWTLRWIFIALFFVYSSNLAGKVLFMIIEMITGVSLSAIDFSADNNAVSVFTNILAMMFLAPFFEELFFRGNFVEQEAKHGKWSTVIILGIMFGLWHCNYDQFIYTSVLGMFAGFMFIKTGSIIPPMLLHFIMNTLGAISSIMATNSNPAAVYSGELDLKAILTMCVGFAIFGIMGSGFILFILEIVLYRDSFKLDGAGKFTEELKTAVIYITSPATIILIIGLAALTVRNALR